MSKEFNPKADYAERFGDPKVKFIQNGHAYSASHDFVGDIDKTGRLIIKRPGRSKPKETEE